MAYTEAVGRANMKYRRKAYDQIGLLAPKGMRDVYRAQAERNGMSLNAYILHLLDAEAAKDAQGVPAAPQTPVDA